MSMPAGKRDRRIRFEQAIETPDASGQPIRTWLPYYTCWAERKPLRGAELFQAQQRNAKVEVEFRILYPGVGTASSLTPRADRRLVDLRDLVQVGSGENVTNQPRPYDITHVEEIGRRDGIAVTAFARAE